MDKDKEISARHVLPVPTQALPFCEPETILIPMKVAESIAGIGRATIYKLQKENKFPKSVQIGGGRIRFVLAEVRAWVQEKIDLSRSGGIENE